MNAAHIRWLNVFLILALCWPFGAIAGNAAAPPVAQRPGGEAALSLLAQSGGNIRALAADSNFAYLGMGARVAIIEISDPRQPVLIAKSEVLPGVINEMAYFWPNVYVATTDGLSVLDVSNPAFPAVLGSFTAPATGMAVGPGGTVYLVGDERLTLVEVILSPFSMTEIVSYTYPSYTWADIALHDSAPYAYLTGGAAIQTVDITAPFSVTVTDVTLLPDAYKSLALTFANNTLYAAACDAGVHSLSLSDPAHPAWAGRADTGYACAHGISVAGNIAHVAAGYDGLLFFDISQPSAPSYISHIETPGKAWHSVAQGSQLIVADGDGMQLFDLSAITSPQQIGQFHTQRQIDSLAAVDQMLYAFDGQAFGGLHTYLVLTPTLPTHLNILPRQWDSTTSLTIWGDRAYYGIHGWQQLVSLSLNDSGQPYIKGEMALPYMPLGVAAFAEPVSGQRYVAVAAGNDGLQIVNVSQPNQMALAGSAAAGDAQDVFVLNQRAYLADGINGLQIYDLADPRNPTLLGGHDTDVYARHVVVVGSLAYVADSNGLVIFDVSNPAAPLWQGEYDTPGTAMRVRVLGNFAFIADGEGGLQVINISDPTAPTLDSSYPIPGFVTDVALADGLVYVAAGDAGLFIYQANYTPAYIVSGQVADGSNIPQAGVSIISPGSNFIQHTNLLGRYQFTHMPEGRHHLYPMQKGYQFSPAERLFNLTSASFNQDFTAQAGTYTVKGRVTNSQGQPLSGVTVADDLGNSAITDAYGDYALALAAGPHHIKAQWQQASFWPPERFADVPPGLDQQDFTIPAPVSLAANLYGGSGQIVARRGAMLYLQSGTALAALNITRPYTPTLTGKTAPLPGSLTDLIITGGRYAYAALGPGGVAVIDLVNPLRPVAAKVLPIASPALGLAASSSNLYISCEAGLAVFSLSDPQNPQQVGWLALPGGGRMALNLGAAYIASPTSLLVLDISTAEAPRHVQTLRGLGYLQDIAFSNNHLFTAASGVPNGLTVLDATIPLSPTQVFSETLPISWGRITIEAGFLYLGSDMALHIYNINIPSDPTLVSAAPFSNAYESAVSGNTIYLTTAYDGLYALDATDRAQVNYRNTYYDDDPQVGKDVAVQGAYAYLIDYWHALRIYNVTSPRSPRLVSKYDEIGDMTSLAVQGDHAYIGTGENGLVVVNVAEPLTPTTVASVSANPITDITLGDGLAYTAGYGPGLSIFDIANPSEPALLSQVQTISDTQRILLDGHLVYLTQPEDGLHVVDVSNPANPSLVAAFNPPELLHGLTMHNGNLFLATEKSLLVLNPANLNGAPLGVFPLPSPAYDVRVAGQYALVAGRDGLWVLNVINLQRIVEANYFPSIPAYTQQLALGSQALFHASELTGLSIFVFDGPQPQKVIPQSGIVDTAHPIAIHGKNFQPGAQFYLGNTSLLSTVVVSNTLATAEIPAGIAPGSYALHVINPDGGTGFLPLAYTAYTTQPPTIAQVTPNQGSNDFPVIVEVYGSNFAPGLSATFSGPQTWTFGVVRYINSGRVRLVVPPGLTTGAYTLTLSNAGGLNGALPNAYTVRRPGEVDDLYAFTPDMFTAPVDARVGQPALLALRVRRQGGSAVLTNVAVRFYDGNPLAGGVLLGSSTIPLLPPGSLAVSIPITFTPTAFGMRQIYAVIDPDNLLGENDEANNTIQRSVRVYPPGEDSTAPQVMDMRINDGASVADAPLVYLNTVAEDEPSGSGIASLLFVEYEYLASRGGWVATTISDWLPYAEAAVEYPWQLAPSPGMHYIQVWAADFAGNVSPAPVTRWINYLPESAAISTYEIHTFRFSLQAGDILQVDLTSLTGDADLYAFAPDGTLLQKSETSGADSVTFTAPGAGIYQIEVEGVSESTYQLHVALNGAAPPALAFAGRPDPRGRVQPGSAPTDNPGDGVGLPGPDFGFDVYLPLIVR